MEATKAIKVSVCASANRIKWWPRFLDSLKGNTIPYEVIFVGDVKPDFDLSNYPEFKHIYATVKPCQCYEIAFRNSTGELIHWSCDDSDYNFPANHCPNSLGIGYEFYKQCEAKFGDKKTIVAMNPCEDGGWPQERWHYFFGGHPWSPRMAPLGLINRDYFVNTLKGYDREFISGQSENDVCMRVFEDGGRVEFCKESTLYIHHHQVHPRNSLGKEDNKFRKFYDWDRRVLEQAWIKEGYGYYEKFDPSKLQEVVHISSTRLVPHVPFDDKDITTVSQGQKGIW